MFNPFKDFETAGYLRNRVQEKDPAIIKSLEHSLFTRKLPLAIDYLAKRRLIQYPHFLHVHEILFDELYPWAGNDRSATAPEIAVSKAGILFAHPKDAARAVSEGLRLAQTAGVLKVKPGEIMGLFAHGHPFLDGNGRTMLVVHAELCFRSGFSIDWRRSNKTDYLRALTDELATPGKGILDRYLLAFVSGKLERADLRRSIVEVKGIDGVVGDDTIEGRLDDEAIQEKYRELDRTRDYRGVDLDASGVAGIADDGPGSPP